MAQNAKVNIMEIDAIDMDFSNITVTPTNKGLKVSGTYIHIDKEYSIDSEFEYPDSPSHPMAPNLNIITEWNLYFWETDHSWHLDVGAIKYPPENPFAVVNIAFGWIAGKQCNTPFNKDIWHIKPLPMDEKNLRPTHGVTSDGSHYHHHPKNKNVGVLVSGPTVVQQ